MTYIECRAQDCIFLVTSQDEYCPNCGISKPQLQVSEDYFKSVAYNPGKHGCFLVITFCVVLFATEIVLGLFAKDFLRSSPYSNEPNVPLLIFLMGIITAVIFFGGLKILKLSYGVPSDPNARRTPNLQQSKEIIQGRLHEIEKREAQIREVLWRVKKNTGEQWVTVQKTLESALVTLQNQFARYNIKQLEIELVRWQNKLAPLISNLDRLTYEQNQSRLKAIDVALESGDKMRGKLAKQRATLGSTPDMKELSTRLDEVLTSCRKVHDALVGRQAVLALKGVTPLKDSLHPVASPTAGIRELEVFNAQVAITDFSSSFEELEAEYIRVQSEEDLGQQISQILEKAEGNI